MDSDPKRLIPLSRPKDLGLGLDTPNDVFRIMKSDPRFPPVYKIRGKNFIIASDRDRYRNELIAEALREAGCGVKRLAGV
jgi:hypothetical protein